MPVTARAEHVGSLLRPPFLQQARAARARGEVTPAEFKAAEDRAVREVIALQEEIGLPVVNDGEQRRDSFQAELAAACDGFAGVSLDAWLWGDWHSAEVGDALDRPPRWPGGGGAAPQAAEPGGRGVHLRARLHQPAGQGDAAEPDAVRQPLVAGRCRRAPIRAWMPSWPTWCEVLQDEVRELVRLGCTYIQLDAPHYPLLLDPAWRAFYEARGWPADRWLSYGIDLDNAVIEAGRPATFGFHLCRGNQLGRWLVAGDYDPIAAPVFGRVHADRLLLEYDDERSGSFGAAPPGARRQGHRARPGDDEDVRARAGRRHRGQAPPGQRAGRGRAAGRQPAVRLRHVGGRQPDHAAGPARQARPARSDSREFLDS